MSKQLVVMIQSRFFFSFFAVLLFSGLASVAIAQKYLHDELFFQQWMSMEDADMTPSGTEYDILFPNYKDRAAAYGAKTMRRFYYNLKLSNEVEYADSIAALYEHRLKELGIETADRLVDTQYLTEGSRIEAMRDKIQTQCLRIVLAGGTEQDKRFWLNRYYTIMIDGLKAAGSYQPGYKRKEAYLALYGDLVMMSRNLAAFLRHLYALKKLKEADKGKKGYKLHFDSIVHVRLGMWKLAISASAPIKSYPIKNVWWTY